MTPLGEKLRALRAERGMLLKDMAAALEISPAYLSALEHGRRGTASAGLLHQICQIFGLIWDDADELKALARQSRPRLRLNSAGLSATQTALANRLVKEFGTLDEDSLKAIETVLDAAKPLSPPITISARRRNQP